MLVHFQRQTRNRPVPASGTEDPRPQKQRMSLFLQSWGRQPLSWGRTWSRCVSFLKSPHSVGIVVPKKRSLSPRVRSSEGLSPALPQDHNLKPSYLWEDGPPSGARERTGPSPPAPGPGCQGLCKNSSFKEESWCVCLLSPASESTKPQCSGSNRSRISMYSSSPDLLCAARTPAPPH